MAKRYNSIADIPSPLVVAWEQAAQKGEYEIECEDEREAHSMQMRLYSVRKTLVGAEYHFAIADSSQPRPELDIRNMEIVRRGNRLIVRLAPWLRLLLEKQKQEGLWEGEGSLYLEDQEPEIQKQVEEGSAVREHKRGLAGPDPVLSQMYPVLRRESAGGGEGNPEMDEPVNPSFLDVEMEDQKS